ncbi:hypothetical protein ECG_05931 [Echinococcus granulosus]|uniref:Uncharacterized protein n=1 Tax=Echinococcus granulosus TaxID=6210 RepID=A0A068WGJ6_ECHGR|nr:hypothetical protein ECG_05931 [Echinococcus granulosus]CDS18864.1 hypothetical protein EgrG_000671200 [Echinococcus granulosus]
MHLRRFNYRECSCPKEIVQETTVCNKLVSMRTLDYRDGQCGRLITADAKSLVKVHMTPESVLAGSLLCVVFANPLKTFSFHALVELLLIA